MAVDERVRLVSPGDGDALALTDLRALLNPGSVGQPRDGIPAASYAILDLAAAEMHWHRVAYDIAAVQAAMRAVDLPDPTRRAAGVRPMIGGRRPLQGRKPGDRRVRVERPHAPYFRYSGEGTLTAKEAASIPTTPGARALAKVRAILIGPPLHQAEEIGERLSKTKALAIFSSDAISSSAYATEEIILAFILGGFAMAALDFALPVSIAIAALLAIVAFSYRQVCIAYPNGGGSYSVSKANFGKMASLVAASALLIDYNLTAAVSTSSAVEQIVSAFPALGDVRVLIGVGSLALITLANLRGLREAGNIFALPTYLFMFSAFAMIAIGTYRIVVLGEHHAPPPEVVAATANTAGAVSIVLLLRAFASGAVALTGTEAIATGVPAFKPPEPRNAATTLLVMAGVLAVLFIGITFLASNFAVYPTVPELYGEGVEHKTVIAQVAGVVFGNSILFYLFQRSRPCSCSSPRTRPSPRSRGWPRSSARTASSLGSSASAATGWPSRPGSCSSASWPPHWSSSPAGGPMPSSRCTPSASSSTSPSARPG